MGAGVRLSQFLVVSMCYSLSVFCGRVIASKVGSLAKGIQSHVSPRGLNLNLYGKNASPINRPELFCERLPLQTRNTR